MSERLTLGACDIRVGLRVLLARGLRQCPAQAKEWQARGTQRSRQIRMRVVDRATGEPRGERELSYDATTMKWSVTAVGV